jgi:hypothetical protein
MGKKDAKLKKDVILHGTKKTSLEVKTDKS